ncbi:MAG TPA: type II toxin-antitoxin system PemK/MazF family toxin [Gemmataceae bacterium]|nr:type II toxin-antitoxin system PemK/MazF family toxin [Gemmataceae bacterium]
MTAKGFKPPVSPMRGELYWLDFAPATGHEMTGDHPCLVVQNDVGNRLSALTIVAAITTTLRVASLPIGVLLPAGTGGLKQDSVVHCGHVYTVDKLRLSNKIGDLPAAKMTEVDLALARSLGLKP